MEETGDITDDQYTDVNETINPGNVVTENITENVAANEAATTVPDADLRAASGSGAGLGTAPETVRGNRATQPFNPESEKRKGREDILNLIANQGNDARSRTSVEFYAHRNIDPEDPDTVPDEV